MKAQHLVGSFKWYLLDFNVLHQRLAWRNLQAQRWLVQTKYHSSTEEFLGYKDLLYRVVSTKGYLNKLRQKLLSRLVHIFLRGSSCLANGCLWLHWYVDSFPKPFCWASTLFKSDIEWTRQPFVFISPFIVGYFIPRWLTLLCIWGPSPSHLNWTYLT